MSNWLVQEPVTVSPSGVIPLSFSAFVRARHCALSVAFSKDGAFPGRMHPKARMGIAFHEVLAGLRRGQQIDASDALVALHEALRKQRELAQANYREAGLPWPKDLREAMELAVTVRCTRAASAGGSTTATIEATLFARDGMLVGRPDEVLTDDQDACVVDYKSGRSDSANIEELEDQLIFYAGLWHDVHGIMPRRGRIEFLVDRTRHEFVIDSTRVEALMSEAREIARTMEDGEKIHDANVGDHCGLCDYRPWCSSYWRDREVLGVNADRDLSGVLCREHPRDSKAVCVRGQDGHTVIVNRSRASLPSWSAGTALRIVDLVGTGSTRFRADWTEIFSVAQT